MPAFNTHDLGAGVARLTHLRATSYSMHVLLGNCIAFCNETENS